MRGAHQFEYCSANLPPNCIATKFHFSLSQLLTIFFEQVRTMVTREHFHASSILGYHTRGTRFLTFIQTSGPQSCILNTKKNMELLVCSLEYHNYMVTQAFFSFEVLPLIKICSLSEEDPNKKFSLKKCVNSSCLEKTALSFSSVGLQ